jgi:hypothetical protein
MQSAELGNDFDGWLKKVSAHSLLVQPDDINAEALANLHWLSLESEQARDVTTECVQRLINDVVAAWRGQQRERSLPEIVFYCWHDAQAGQLRISAVSRNHGRLPFGCQLEQVAELSVVVNDWLESPYRDGIPSRELQSDENARQEASDLVQAVWVTRLD